MNGCSYLIEDTKEPIAWTANYSSRIMQYWISKGINLEIIEEPFYIHMLRQQNWSNKYENNM